MNAYIMQIIVRGIVRQYLNREITISEYAQAIAELTPIQTESVQVAGISVDEIENYFH